MYSSCNCCIFNFNGIQADSGALAEIGNLGARGVPISIIKGQVTADFAGANNPMPTMCASSNSNIFPVVQQDKNGIYAGFEGVIDNLSDKIDKLSVSKNIGSFAQYNYYMPLPPLQVYWSAVGSLTYFMKHKNKSIPTVKNGAVNYNQDYTDFWIRNVIKPKNTRQGWLNVGKECAKNLYVMMQNPVWKEIYTNWY